MVFVGLALVGHVFAVLNIVRSGDNVFNIELDNFQLSSLKLLHVCVLLSVFFYASLIRINGRMRMRKYQTS